MQEGLAIIPKVFSPGTKILPSVTEIFELELAYLEYEKLKESDLISRSAYLMEYNGELTRHFLAYRKRNDGITQNRSAQTQNYFEKREFITGYATHGLFPYRGKFHPQLIKAILNIIGLHKGETLLDPMCGSGTANIEAALLGINSIAIDVSPFYLFMTKVKYDSLTIQKELLKQLTSNKEKLFDFFPR
ncbi:MAG: hypothetical protein Kow0090_00040 [Myxococcota bacterium]